MSGLHHREPGLVGACFSHPSVRASIIPDGFHVDFTAINIARKMLGERLFVITDGVTESSTGPYPHQLHEDHYEANGIISGSALTMIKAVKNLISKGGIPKAEALKMCNLYPAKVLNKGDEMSMIRKSYPAELLVLDEEINVVDLITTGL